MPTCHHCDATHTAEELTRHERPGVVLVHCPDCDCLLGRYRRHGDAPETDRLREA
ncbi:hypothetical protein ACFO0N_19190 [Halobium salinum]|uniref:Small CPxCG-related zinc finger protein n=2 Tax=Halobium salinum TaxID=1364940 RepID=A0ABD5PGP4_9EURY|nr:hypothetical protein [Halobium salinum]